MVYERIQQVFFVPNEGIDEKLDQQTILGVTTITDEDDPQLQLFKLYQNTDESVIDTRDNT